MNKKAIILGMIAGIASGLIGIGGGLIMVPGMVYYLGVKQHMANATSLTAILPLGAIGAISYACYGNLDLRLAATFAAGGIIGSYLGAAIMPHVNPSVLRRIMGLICIWTAFKIGGIF